VECSVCGRDCESVIARPSRDDVRLCRDCIEWMMGRVGVSSMPTLPVVNLSEAVVFYESAGFGVKIYHDEDGKPGDFAFGPVGQPRSHRSDQRLIERALASLAS
jgi:hypothetical protein